MHLTRYPHHRAKNPKLYKDKLTEKVIKKIMAVPKKTSPAPAAAAAATKPAAPAPAKPVAAKKEPVVAAPAPAAPVVAAAPVAEAAPSLLDKLETKVKALADLVKETVTELKAIKKEYERLKKSVDKTERKRANARSNPNGFAKPVPISDELCHFLSMPVNSELSRTDITRKINAYIKQHNLNKPENKRFILPDAALRKLFQLAAGEEISYFSIQKHITKVIKPKVA